MQRFAVSLLVGFIEHYSPTGHEAELSQFMLKKMKAIGLKTRTDRAGNAIGEFGEGVPTILLCGHMDTVQGKLPIRLEEGKLYGRGAVDAKASLAAMVATASILLKEKFSGRLIVVGVIDEEGKSRGTRQLIEDGVTADYAIFGEPSGIDQITIAYKGSLHIKVLVKTASGHSSVPWLFENAIERSFDIYTLLRAINFSEEKKDSKFYSLTSSFTKIAGGSLSSQIPSKCAFHVDFRVPPNVEPMKLFDNIKMVIQEYHKIKPAVCVEVEVLDSCKPYEVDTNSLLIHSLSWAIRMVRSKPATWVRKTGSGDMNLYGASLKIPIVTYGAGNSSLDHTSNEWVDLKEYEDSIQILYKGIKKLVELHNKRK
ncbi:MAG: M20/M25/M40 family metallo-hydrolase [Candidatus Bathyarchaeota archaeon]